MYISKVLLAKQWIKYLLNTTIYIHILFSSRFRLDLFYVPYHARLQKMNKVMHQVHNIDYLLQLYHKFCNLRTRYCVGLHRFYAPCTTFTKEFVFYTRNCRDKKVIKCYGQVSYNPISSYMQEILLCQA